MTLKKGELFALTPWDFLIVTCALVLHDKSNENELICLTHRNRIEWTCPVVCRRDDQWRFHFIWCPSTRFLVSLNGLSQSRAYPNNAHAKRTVSQSKRTKHILTTFWNRTSSHCSQCGRSPGWNWSERIRDTSQTSIHVHKSNTVGPFDSTTVATAERLSRTRTFHANSELGVLCSYFWSRPSFIWLWESRLEMDREW